MKLYLVQHGQALTKQEEPTRPLSKQGETDIENLAKFLENSKLQISRVLHSGKTRSRQTAEIISFHIFKQQNIEKFDNINPTDSALALIDWIQEWIEDILIVGHQPFMGKLVSRLITSDIRFNITKFTPGTIVCLEKTLDQKWTIQWMLNPELFPR